ncbi:uncharacterized protein MICPUCDRAFT_68172 [Micromonas pusilla CCMP1545]|uniref:Predicted protein n=1 Tax=Micromonas pusilla (strain CCMP1545) TaxID=564608 RepID=C1MTH3_MICPC|nr:uncharacterized protein MICPUCDRAFT_68172 [Micromonas pusilla CCMP1545]EEH56944.1 predicted protein [Micromonas pusilla CCMP1545]|eukprot:XP_003058489.1 predicted protein [Micromonas pusilla CCMP1545]
MDGRVWDGTAFRLAAMAPTARVGRSQKCSEPAADAGGEGGSVEGARRRPRVRAHARARAPSSLRDRAGSRADRSKASRANERGVRRPLARDGVVARGAAEARRLRGADGGATEGESVASVRHPRGRGHRPRDDIRRRAPGVRGALSTRRSVRGRGQEPVQQASVRDEPRASGPRREREDRRRDRGLPPAPDRVLPGRERDQVLGVPRAQVQGARPERRRAHRVRAAVSLHPRVREAGTAVRARRDVVLLSREGQGARRRAAAVAARAAVHARRRVSVVHMRRRGDDRVEQGRPRRGFRVLRGDPHRVHRGDEASHRGDGPASASVPRSRARPRGVLRAVRGRDHRLRAARAESAARAAADGGAHGRARQGRARAVARAGAPSALGAVPGAFYTLVPIRPRWRGERRSLRTFPGASLRPSLAFNPRPGRLSTPLLTPLNSTPTFARMERPSDATRPRAAEPRVQAPREAPGPRVARRGHGEEVRVRRAPVRPRRRARGRGDRARQLRTRVDGGHRRRGVVGRRGARARARARGDGDEGRRRRC